MTIPASTRRMPAASTDGVKTVFAFDFKVFSDADVRVVWESTLGVQTTLVLGTNYSVTRNPNQDTSPGGIITTTSPYPTGLLAILGASVYQQGTDVPNAGPFSGDTVEAAIDYAVILIQQLREAIDRSLKITPIDGAIAELPSSTLRASKYLYFDAFGNPTAASVVSAGSLSVTAFGESLVEAADAGAATNILFSGLGRRIQADFSNAALASRAMFQTSIPNNSTNLTTIPSGLGNTSGYQAYNNSDPLNSSFFVFQSTSIGAEIVAARTGTGVFQPIVAYTSNIERMRIDANGNVFFSQGLSFAGSRIVNINNGDAGAGSSAQLTIQSNAGALSIASLSSAGGGLAALSTTLANGLALNATLGRLQFLTNNLNRFNIRNDGTFWTDNNLIPAFFNRAWVNFNGQGTLNVRASGNATVTDLGVGTYRVTFVENMPDANYVVEVNASLVGGGTSFIAVHSSGAGVVAPTNAQFQFLCVVNGVAYDPEHVNVVVSR